jgi:ABC-type nitrate/sulfonate/bicarbonate transport system ATPase subunit
MNNFALKLKNIYKHFGDGDGGTMPALKDIDLAVERGEFFVMLGPSGSGKSTILRIMSGLECEFGGTLELGADLHPEDLNFVFQQFALLPWLTVAENVRLGLSSRGIPEKEKDRVVRGELEQLGLAKFASAHPHELSGGMKQRVGLARAFATDPKILFLDEPFSELDSFTAEELRAELLRVHAERKMTIVMVTHLIDEALELADRIAVLTPRPGHIEKIVHNPLSRPRAKRSPEFFKLYDELYNLIKP